MEMKVVIDSLATEIERKRQELSALEKAREILLRQYGISEPTPKQATNIGGEKKTRKQQLEEFLRTHGPASRGEILSITGMPKGTVAYLLNNNKDIFYNEGGKWKLRELSSESSTEDENEQEKSREPGFL